MKIEIEREDDGRWVAEVPDLSGVMVYGQTRRDAVAKAEALALRVIADRLDHVEAGNSPLQDGRAVLELSPHLLRIPVRDYTIEIFIDE